MSAIKQLVESAISSNNVMMFSKSYCGYCAKAKNILKTKGIIYEAIELDQRTDGVDIQDYLATKTGQRSVPNIFIKSKHIGGSSDLADIDKNGNLKKLVMI